MFSGGGSIIRTSLAGGKYFHRIFTAATTYPAVIPKKLLRPFLILELGVCVCELGFRFGVWWY